MVESRDRLIRAVDLAQLFVRRLFGIFSDEARELLVFPVVTPTLRCGGRHRESSFVTPRSVVRHGFPSIGRENTPLTVTGHGRGRGTSSVLPSWYPRPPLNDITAVVRAIERRRARSEGLTIPEDEGGLSSNVSSGVQLEHNFSTPASTARLKPCPLSVPEVSKILLGGINMNAEESELLTPQKKLLNSIDTVGKAVMEELQKLKRTPSSRKQKGKRKSAH
ncbi:protein POLYCHOME-like [Hibiscus syriacus]|uniref:protein POLYCHOME-like n=1 Tax=Hibiscus syriacus TaxID=106335 RepID=UPI001922BDBD|nr:protein POLYCHOME-like [Hibiscus syriacus]